MPFDFPLRIGHKIACAHARLHTLPHATHTSITNPNTQHHQMHLIARRLCARSTFLAPRTHYIIARRASAEAAKIYVSFYIVADLVNDFIQHNAFPFFPPMNQKKNTEFISQLNASNHEFDQKKNEEKRQRQPI